MAGKILGRTGLRLSPFGASLEADGGVPPMRSFETPPNWCEIPVDIAHDVWARLNGLLQAQWSTALTEWAHSAGASQASSAVGGEPGGGRGRPLTGQTGKTVDEIHHPDFSFMVRVGPSRWDRSMSEAVDQVLWRTGQPQIDVLQLGPFDLERIKAGEPFRRMSELRNAGRVRFFCVAVDTLKDARWVVENTPVHAVRIGASHQEPGWSELFEAANGADTGIIAGPSVAGGDLDTARRLLTDTPIAGFAWPVDLS